MISTQSTKSPASERRVAVRRQPTLGTVCRLDPGRGGAPHLGLVWNLSTTGISMLLHTPMEPGAALQGDLTTMHDEGSLPISGRIVHLVKLRTGDYFVGALFNKPLSAEDMRPFVGPYRAD